MLQWHGYVNTMPEDRSQKKVLEECHQKEEEDVIIRCKNMQFAIL